jgi:hypothetical protein
MGRRPHSPGACLIPMKRPYLALATFALVAALTPVAGPRAWANGLFESAPVNAPSFAVLARPVGNSDWSLVVLEQLRARPFCWTPRPDGLVDPTLNRFDYTGVCGRFIDSNGYSLRLADADLGPNHRLRVQQRGGELQLLATTPVQGGEVLVGRGPLPRRDRDLFVALQLEPGWELRRRTFGERSLNHIYFSNSQSFPDLIAASSGRPPAVETARVVELPVVPPPPTPSRSRVERRLRPPQAGRLPTSPDPAPGASREEPGLEGSGAGVVALQVIPYEERLGGEERSEVGGESRSAAQGL